MSASIRLRDWVYSSRKMEAKTCDDVAFRYLSADAHPDHDTLAEFRKRHLESLAGLFTQALLLCEKAGLVKLGHVSIDGTKIKANASKHKAMSYARMGETEQRLKAEIEALLKQAEDVDAAEDAQYGKGKRGDELPEELARRESRLKRIAQAKAELEQEAREKAEQERAEAEAELAKRRDEEERTGKKERGREPTVPVPEQAQSEAKAQTVRTALQLINRFLADDEFDPETQFCIQWFETNYWKPGQYGVADVAARAKGTSVDALFRAGVLNSGGGEVQLLRWNELPTDWKPDPNHLTPVWEALHYLIRNLNMHGEQSAGALLANMSTVSGPVRTLAYRLYTLCERKGLAEDARPYNELIGAWAAIEVVADEIGPIEKQGELF